MQEAVLLPTWTTCPSKETVPYVEPPFLEEIRERDGAGPAATVKHGSWLLWLRERWGLPIHDSEPISLSTAKMQQEITEYTHRFRLWFDEEQHNGLPLASRMRIELEDWLSIMWKHMVSLMEKEIPTLYSTARDIEHYENLTLMPPPTNRIDYKELKARIDIVEYVGRYVTLRKMGQTYRGKCPLHAEKTPSFYVYVKTASYYCFGCDKGGDVIDFAKAMGVERLG